MNVDAVIKRAYLSLEDGDFAKANELLDQVLNEDPENADVYVGLLCAELKVYKESELANCKVPIANYNNFKKAIRFGDGALVTRLNNYNTVIINNLALEEKKREYSSAKALLAVINKNPEVTPEQCMQKAVALSDIAKKFRAIGDYEDAMIVADKCESDAAKLTVLSEQRKQEFFASTTIKKKKITKRLSIAGIIVILVTVGLFTYIKIDKYNESLPGKYYNAYHSAFADGNYEEAQKMYKKHLDITDSEKGSSGTLEDYIVICNLAKISEEGLQAFVDGDFEKGKELFTREVEMDGWMLKASLYYVPYNIIKELLPQLLEKLNPVQIQIQSYGYYSITELYWLNSDGTVGTIDGHPSVSDWKDIVEIKASGDTIAGLTKGGTLIYKSGEYETQTIDNVTDFDVYDYIVAVVKNDGTVMYIGEVTGSEFVSTWGNVKTVKIMRELLYEQYLDWGPNSSYKKPEIKSETNGYKEFLVAQTNDGEILTSGFNIKIYPPEEASVEDIVNSIQNAPSWGTVLDPALRATLQRPLRDGYTQVMEPASLDTDFSEVTELRLNLYGIDIPVSQDSNGNWIIH